MTAFDRTWAFLQRPDIEGGARLVNDPDDPGGATKWGISKRAYPEEDIPNMTEARAKELFRRDYWDKCRCEWLPPELAMAVADAAFNQGPSTAIRELQAALKVTVDGVVGAQTVAAAQRVGADGVNEFLSHRLLRYASGLLKFRRGWFLRVLRLKDAMQ